MALPFDDIASTTIDTYITGGKLIDNIFKAHPLFYWMYKKGRIKHQDGGDQISIPVMPKTNTLAAFIAPTQVIDTTIVATATRARFNWKHAVCSIAISKDERLRNSGSKQQIVNLLTSKIDQSEGSTRESINTELWAATQSANGLLPLRVIIAATGTLGGIDSSVETWWQSKVDNTAEPLTIADMGNLYNQCARGRGGPEAPDLLIGGQTLYEKYENLLQPQQRLDNADMADGGFDHLLFKKKPFVWDEQAPSDEIEFLNSKYLFLTVHPEADFNQAPLREPTNQLVFVSHIHWMGNLVTSQRRALGKLDGRTA